MLALATRPRFTCEAAGRTVVLSIQRIKNKFAHVDPTHFRNLLLNYEMSVRDLPYLQLYLLH